MDSCCVVTGQDERGKSVFVQKKPIEPVSLAQVPGCAFSVSVSPRSETVQSLGAKFSIGFKLVLVGRCSTIWSKSLSSRVPGAPDIRKAPKCRYLKEQKNSGPTSSP